MLSTLNPPPKFPTQPDDFDRATEERGLKQKWLAWKLGLPAYRFSQMKNGYVAFPREKVVPLADLLGVSPDQVGAWFAVDGFYKG